MDKIILSIRQMFQRAWNPPMEITDNRGDPPKFDTFITAVAGYKREVLYQHPLFHAAPIGVGTGRDGWAMAHPLFGQNFG